MKQTGMHEVIQTRFLSESAFVLRFTREAMQFKAGQRILVGLAGDLDLRDYSIYSGENDDYLEILLREVNEGNVSVKLKHCQPGQLLNVNGPFGSFTPDAYDVSSKKYMFVATGTGISPFHSIVRSYPAIDYTLLHGIRFKNEAYEKNEYGHGRYIICTSAEMTDGRKGRVTEFLKNFRTVDNMLFYLCGNGDMIYDVSHILKDKGIPEEKIFSEIYF